MPELVDRIDFFHSQFLIRQHQVPDTLTLQTLERALQTVYLVIQYRVFTNTSTQQMLDDVPLPQTGTMIIKLLTINDIISKIMDKINSFNHSSYYNLPTSFQSNVQQSNTSFRLLRLKLRKLSFQLGLELHPIIE
jgi:hypothetical protein